MKGKAALNRVFVSFPQLNRLVTTTNFIDKKAHVRELHFTKNFQLNQLSKLKTKELG
jgi:hypothetical protein